MRVFLFEVADGALFVLDGKTYRKQNGSDFYSYGIRSDKRTRIIHESCTVEAV